ncbi:glucosamine-6-phosphate deaminase [Virgibacillus byunsanensis]|uniref:Glucosamine-6-phosphate deaminase n=1 Tax=Virgibacillus byunsanensis TaxID=570945 RepID=A0ABW3LM58_9BACI
MEVIKVKNYDAMSEKACSIIMNRVINLDNPVLGLATGSTPEGLYEYLINTYKEGEISFKDTATFNLDEYVGLAPSNPNSYHYYMNEKLFKHIDIPDKLAHVPNGSAQDLDSECRHYEQLMRDRKQIDVQILGLGLNGHIGFNEPGTSFESRTHVIDLDETTRKANARFFDAPEDVPNKAITMGLETIMDSKEIILLVSGARKAEPLARLLHGEVSEEFPASILQNHKDVVIIADEASLSELEI